MVEQMLAGGASAGVIVLAVRAMERRHAERSATRYAERTETLLSMTPGAIRSRRHRQNTKENGGKAKANDVAIIAPPQRHAERSAVTPPCELSSLLSKSGTREEEKKKEVVTRARGTRMSSEATVSDADRQFAREHGLSDIAIDRAWAEFVDFWTGIPGQRGTKLNWPGTWRNRIRDITGKSGKQDAKKAGSLSETAGRLATQGVVFGPRPSGVLSPENAANVRLLEAGRRDQPGDHGTGGGGHPLRISDRNN